MGEGAAKEAKSHWLAAAQLGLISSTFSTLVSQLAAAQLGRDALVDWMTVAAIPGRDAMLSATPSAQAIALGIAFHQWADFSWALVFFGVFGRRTGKLDPGSIFWLAAPWAAFTSATEWLVLVPLFPFFQPIFTLQQPNWIGFLVHLSSALIYPLFAWVRWPFGNSGRTLCKVLGGGGAFGARSARHSCPGGKLWLDVADAQPRDGRRSALYPPYGDAS